MEELTRITPSREPWNKGKLVGQKTPLKLKDIGAIRVRLQIRDRVRDLALSSAPGGPLAVAKRSAKASRAQTARQ